MRPVRRERLRRGGSLNDCRTRANVTAAETLGTVTLFWHRLQLVETVLTAVCGASVQPSAQQNGSAVRTTAIIESTRAAASLRTMSGIIANPGWVVANPRRQRHAGRLVGARGAMFLPVVCEFPVKLFETSSPASAGFGTR
jgi:hypothetical protein